MYSGRQPAIFEDRHDAGKKLALELTEYHRQSVLVLAIPNGGVPVGLEISESLEADFDLIICRKIPLPFNPEAGFGAVADDGTVMLNEELVAGAGLRQREIDYQIDLVKAEIARRNSLYRQGKPAANVSKRRVILTDDGLASGFTMMAAVQSVRHRQARKVIVAVPCASVSAYERLKDMADRVITLAIGSRVTFAVADFYRQWYDLSEAEVLSYLEEWRSRSRRSPPDR